MTQFTLENSMGFLVNRTAMKLKNELIHAFKSKGFNITTEQWAVLMCLWEQEARTQSEIAETLVKDKTNVTRILDLMEKKELIVRRSHENDRRSYRIFLTEKGKGLKESLIPLATEANLKSSKGLTQEDLEELKRIMNIIYGNLK
ncbi:MAG: MarR family transcriptional regulator [bacterium]|nr:MarR family transcriptional regulator [bacterium]